PREAPDDEPDGGLRCPECGSSYVLERGDRCRCRRCDHRFDADAPPVPPLRHRRGAPADDGVPAPVFRLRRDHRGLGLFLGAVGALFAAMVLRAEAVAPGWVTTVALALPALGWLVGRGVREEVCSEPSCRAPLARAAERCPGCGAAVAWPIRRAGEHYAARARWLRGERPRSYP
ncbi:MAG: hypothetical protein IT373_22485, partial [Polyangiaceae bacterium]|nr:hypothetical protein [Polyangiaceae bacterium]